MNWDLYLESHIKPEFIVGSNIIKYNQFLEDKRNFKLKHNNLCKVSAKQLNKLFKLQLMAKYRELLSSDVD